MQLMKVPFQTTFSHVPNWLKWIAVVLCFLIPVWILLKPYTLSANQIRQNYFAALKKKDYQQAYEYLDQQQQAGVISFDAFKQWLTAFPEEGKQIEIHKAPLFGSSIYIWRVVLPSKRISIQLPFANADIAVDGITHHTVSSEISLPVFIGKHTVSMSAKGISLARQTIDVTSAPQLQSVTLNAAAPPELVQSIRMFLIQYNQTWCRAVNIQSPEGILAFLTGKQSPEYKFLNDYIRTLKTENWIRDLETFQSLQMINSSIKDDQHILVSTKETYHHDLTVIKNHENWRQGDKKSYDSTVYWTYNIKLLDAHKFQIESLQR
ncbi:hypothetical protein LSG31_22155 [Fodinisporobacter ferrooxydans]|uniref:Uncharacterized protein n=1 Tax=Fodinisporobacter ferrooxydans TaxID=2901836 RepID=A0ABY4CRP2_9BACL|nr:hypothetical protein LSG31_22155 [Alicyclobacillaceae bacterium MYW30-H2]